MDSGELQDQWSSGSLLLLSFYNFDNNNNSSNNNNPGSSPTKVSALMVEDPGNFNSCKHSANGVVKPQEKYGIAIFK